jgi:hypothetical protein
MVKIPSSDDVIEMVRAVIVGGFVLLIVAGLLSCVWSVFIADTKKSVPAAQTQREKDEWAVKGYLKSRHPEATDKQIDNASKRIVDEWERAK